MSTHEPGAEPAPTPGFTGKITPGNDNDAVGAVGLD